MISRTLRSQVVSSNAAAGRRRLRTSCWVIVDAPRGRPETVSSPALTMPAGSKPGLIQKSLSSIAVVASSISPGIWSKVTSSRRSVPRRASSTLFVRSVTIVCCSKSRSVSCDLGSGRPDA